MTCGTASHDETRTRAGWHVRDGRAAGNRSQMAYGPRGPTSQTRISYEVQAALRIAMHVGPVPPTRGGHSVRALVHERKAYAAESDSACIVVVLST
jgi:hypothetical protein